MKLVVLAAFAAALVAIGGVGYACGGGGGCGSPLSSQCNSGQIGIEWVAPTSTAPNAHGVVCSVVFGASALTVKATDLLPGTFCWLNATLENVGSEPVQLVPHISTTLPKGCLLFTYADNLLSASPEVTLAQGRTFAYRAEYGLAASAGDACERLSASFQVTITASGAPSCQGFGPGSLEGTRNDQCCG